MLIVVFLRVSCALWRFTVCVKASTEASSSRVNSGRRWWSSCSASRSWSFTAACVESPLGKRTKSCRHYPVPTFSISSRCSLTKLEVFAVLPTEFSWVLCASFHSLMFPGVCRQTGRKAVQSVLSPPLNLGLCDCTAGMVCWIYRSSMMPHRLLTDVRKAGSLRMCWNSCRSSNLLLCTTGCLPERPGSGLTGRASVSFRHQPDTVGEDDARLRV